jgi:ABC-2 type transport system permease protein
MNHIMKIAMRELRAYFASPMGYVFLVIFLFSIGYVTFEPGRGSFFILGQADLTSFFRYIPWLFLVLIPAVSMRLWSEERRVGTIELLFTLPVTIREAVLGKFLASWIFICLALALTFPMIITVYYLGDPDTMAIVVGYLGAVLMGGSFLAIGSFFSAATKNQVISFILSMVACYIMLMAGSPPILDFIGNWVPKYFVDVLESLSMLNHYDAMQRGVIQLGDIWYNVLVICAWIWGCMIMLKDKKSV